MKRRSPSSRSRSLTRTHVPREVIDAKDAFDRGDLVRTIWLCEQILAKNPKDINGLHMLGKSLTLGGRFDDAAAVLQRLVKMRPRDANVHFSLAKLELAQAKSREALLRLEKALKLASGHGEASIEKARLLERLGRYDAARRTIQHAGASVRNLPKMIETRCLLALHEGNTAEVIDIADTYGRDETLAVETRAQLAFMKGRALDALGQPDQAMQAWRHANELATRPFDRDQFRAEIDREISFFTRERLQTLPRAAERSESPVFIAGLPRSGTTLVEQIIDAHPQAAGAGELRDLEILKQALPEELGSLKPYPLCLEAMTQRSADLAASRYLQRLQQFSRRDTARVVNKSLENYRLLGLIALLFPHARIVCCHRDPIDTCLSIYMNWFHPGKYPFSTDLGHLGFVYRQAERLMAHWKQVLDLPMQDVQYEELVRSPEDTSRRLIEFLGLEWDDTCLRFHESGRTVMTLSYHQVSKPIYTTSMKRREKYRDHLQPLIDGLEGRDQA